jgi:hypothetical protein
MNYSVLIPIQVNTYDEFGDWASVEASSLVIAVRHAGGAAQAVAWATDALEKLINSNNLGVLDDAHDDD